MWQEKAKLTMLTLAVGSALALLGVACAQQAAEAPATKTVVQAGQLQPAPAGAPPSGWATAESIRGGLTLVAQYDSSGPDAWDPKAHPLVYISSEGTEDESPKFDKSAAYFAGFHLVDAYSKQVFKSALFDVGAEIIRFPHGVGISPDGKWAYVGWGQKAEGPTAPTYSATPTPGLPGGAVAGLSPAADTVGVVAIVNMRTLKIDKLLKQESVYQGQLRSQFLHHIQAFKDSKGNDRVILMWGFGSVGGPHFILDSKNDNKVVKAINYDDVRPIGHPFMTPSPDGKYIYVSMDSPEISAAEAPQAGIAKFNTEDWSIKVIPEVGHHPIGITHTADGKYTYVIEAHASEVYKIDNATNKVVDRTSAGVAGPYGIALNWDETLLFTVGKGEGSHNRGAVLGVVDTKTFRPARGSAVPHEMPIWLGGSASSVDHAILHPDPEVNELWVSNMNGWETIVLDLKTLKPKAYIATPNGGNTHSGGFVRYNPDWTGEWVADQGGPKSKTMWDTVKAKAAAVKR